jgi:adenylate cyclase
VRAGIGLHHGPVLIGDIGGERQFQFTVVGDTVNAASRLEALTRNHESTLIASDEVVARAGTQGAGAALDGLEPLAPVTLRGRSSPMPLWRLRRRPAAQ